MIGLKSNLVKVVEHDPDWAELAADACQQVREACGPLVLDVRHVGSTAVPNLPAKPILDLAASVDTSDVIPELIEVLTGIGYIYSGDEGDSGGYFFVWESRPDVRTIHLHVVTQDNFQWQNYLDFRDILRQDASVRRRYAELKKALGERFPDDRKAYTAAKHTFIRSILEDESQSED